MVKRERCRECGRFLSELQIMGGCYRCADRRDAEKAQAARIAAMPMPPWCPHPYARCICGDEA